MAVAAARSPQAMGYTKDQLLARLQELKIEFTCYNHPVVLTVKEQKKHVGYLGGALSKNLLLKDKKHHLYVVSALKGTKIDMKILSQRLGLGKAVFEWHPRKICYKYSRSRLFSCGSTYRLTKSGVLYLECKVVMPSKTTIMRPSKTKQTKALGVHRKCKVLTYIMKPSHYEHFFVCFSWEMGSMLVTSSWAKAEPSEV